MTLLDVRPLSPLLGAEVRGVDLSRSVDDATFAEVRRLFLDHHVLVFRDQNTIDADVQVAFAERLGPLHTHPAAPQADVHPAVMMIHTHRESRIANGNGWHTDVSCDPEPPMATMLQLHVLPPSGGDTLFASMEAAYDALSPKMRRILSALTAMHESEHVYRGRYSEPGVDADREYPSSEHPVVRTHPETGRQSIYVNRSFTTGLCGLTRAESDGMLAWLFDHVEQPELQIRLTWRTNDVALWDNRCVQHYAMWDYWPHERRGHRVTVKGDRPFHRPAGTDSPPTRVRLRGGSLAMQR